MIKNSKMVLRDYLAVDRTKLANQRTLLSYIRTAVILVASGFTLVKLLPSTDVLYYFGLISLGMACVFLMIGILSYRKTAKNIRALYSNID